MHKAIESRTKLKDGKVVEREWSVGPVLVTTVATVVLALTGHTVFNGIVAAREDHQVVVGSVRFIHI